MRLYFDLDKTDPIHKALCDVACNDENIVSYFYAINVTLHSKL